MLCYLTITTFRGYEKKKIAKWVLGTEGYIFLDIMKHFVLPIMLKYFVQIYFLTKYFMVKKLYLNVSLLVFIIFFLNNTIFF